MHTVSLPDRLRDRTLEFCPALLVTLSDFGWQGAGFWQQDKACRQCAGHAEGGLWAWGGNKHCIVDMQGSQAAMHAATDYCHTRLTLISLLQALLTTAGAALGSPGLPSGR